MVGAILVTLRPSNVVGWLLLVSGVGLIYTFFAPSYVERSLVVGPLPGYELLDWLYPVEQGITLFRDLPPKANITLEGKVVECWDKEKSAVVGVEDLADVVVDRAHVVDDEIPNRRPVGAWLRRRLRVAHAGDFRVVGPFRLVNHGTTIVPSLRKVKRFRCAA